MSISAPGIDARRIAGHIGAEITGVRVTADLPGDVFAIIRQACTSTRSSSSAARATWTTRSRPASPASSAS